MLARTAYVPNGRSRGRRPSDFDPVQLQVGTKVEMEHTTDRRVAQRIAMDHLVEDRAYYKKLAKVHLDGRRTFGAAACSTTPRWVRGGIGFLLGGLLGSMLGGGIAFAIALPSSPSAGTDSFGRIKTATLLATGITVAGAAGGLYFGAAKPEC